MDTQGETWMSCFWINTMSLASIHEMWHLIHQTNSNVSHQCTVCGIIWESYKQTGLGHFVSFTGPAVVAPWKKLCRNKKVHFMPTYMLIISKLKYSENRWMLVFKNLKPVTDWHLAQQATVTIGCLDSWQLIFILTNASVIWGVLSNPTSILSNKHPALNTGTSDTFLNRVTPSHLQWLEVMNAEKEKLIK